MHLDGIRIPIDWTGLCTRSVLMSMTEQTETSRASYYGIGHVVVPLTVEISG